MKLNWLMLAIFLLVIPTSAQDSTSYEFETGTVLEYPETWNDDLVDGVLTLSNGSISQVLVLDYPLVDTLSEDITREIAVQQLASLLLEIEITSEEIYEFELENRTISAYDIGFDLSGSVYGVSFTNGAIGLMVTIEVDEDIETDLLRSFDNQEERLSDTALPSGRNAQPRAQPSLFLFPTDQRFLVPAGWELDVRQRDDLQYTILSVPETDVSAWLIDLSEIITKGVELEDVIDEVPFDWQSDFDITILGDANPYRLGDREAILYDVEIDGLEGYLVILRYSDDAIGTVIVAGDSLDDYQAQINQLIGSFNNLGAILSFLQ